MAEPGSQKIPTEQFLLIATNLLHRGLIAVPRHQGKRLFRELEQGKVISLQTIRMEDRSTVAFRLELDHSEFDGKFNFGAFRSSLSLLINNISRVLQEKRQVRVFQMQNREQSVMFGVTGITVEGEIPQVLVLGADTSGPPGNVLLRLMYLDYRQFVQSGQDPARTQAESQDAGQ